MEERYVCYCGLYCANCPVKAKVEPAAKTLYDEMKAAGFEEIIHFLPGGEGFWQFLGGMALDGACVSCKEGSGNPGCGVRICAQERGVGACALCGDYPCGLFDRYFEGYPVLKEDNALLRDDPRTWAALQDKRRAEGFTYSQSL